MNELKVRTDQLIQQKNDMELQIQAVDHERAEIDRELNHITEVTSTEQQKHKANLERQHSSGEEELA